MSEGADYRKGAPSPSSAPRVGIVIVNWNLADDTLACLDSVWGMSYPNFEVVVVDNGSTDGSVERIAAAHPQTAQIANEENLGFAAGANRGIDWALGQGCAYVLVLNSDTTVAPDLLDPMVAAGETDARIGILSPRILYHEQPERTWHLAARWRPCLPMPVNIRQAGAPIVEADFVSGCAMMLRREALEQLGGFDPAYFMYGEDVDLCLRAKASGYRIVAVPPARIWHKVSLSAAKVSAETRYWQTRNQIRVYRRHLTGVRRRLLPGYVAAKALLDLVRRLAKGQRDQIRPLFRGVRDGLWGPLP